MINRMVLVAVAALVAVGAFLTDSAPAAAQGQGLYFWAGATSQGEQLELSVKPGSTAGNWTVTAVRLNGATVKCAKSTEELDLSEVVFPAHAPIRTMPAVPFTIARLATDDHQVALLLTSQSITYNQIKATLTVYWSHLYYSGAKDTVPVSERCTAVLPVTLHLLIAD